MKIEYLRRLARLALDSRDEKLMVMALELVVEENAQAQQLIPAAVLLGLMAQAVRNLIAVWKNSGQRENINLTHLTNKVLSKLSDEDMRHLFPAYKKTDRGVVRGDAIEARIRDINIGLHTDEIVCTHGNGRRFSLRPKAVREWK